MRAAVSPSAIGVTAAGVAIGLLLAQSVVLAVVLGAGAWAVRMLVAVWRQARLQRQSKPQPASLDPWSVPEPWRSLVRQALDSQSRFDHTVDDWPAGPIRDRLSDLRPRLYSSVAEIGTLSRRGAALSGTVAGVAMTGQPSVAQLGEQLRRTEAERVQAAATSPDHAASLARTEEALAAQIRAVRTSEDAAGRLLDRLRVVVARLDETVTALLLVGVDGTSDPAADALVRSLDDLHDEIASLGAGLADTTSLSEMRQPSGPLPPQFGATPLPSPPPPTPLPSSSPPAADPDA
jgi:hypothetical protein